MGTLLGGFQKQGFISDRRALPVDVIADTAYNQSISGETVQLYYFNAGVLTIDAGQAAGTVVVAKLAYSGILDGLGGMIGNNEDTSLSWTTDTVLPLASIQGLNVWEIENENYGKLEEIAKAITRDFSNGQWVLDHRTGIIYGKKATTGVSDTATYKISTQSTGGGTSIADTVNIGKIGNNTVTGGAGNVAAGSQRVTIATDDANLAAIKTAIELLDNAVGQTRTVSISPTVDTDAYTANDIVGGKLTITNAARTSGGSGVILGVTLIDMSKQDVEYDIFIFEQDPTNGTYTDDLTIDIHDTDADFLVGHITISPGHYADAADNSVATVNNINLPFTASGSANLYAIAVTRGTPTYAAATDVQLRFKIAQD